MIENITLYGASKKLRSREISSQYLVRRCFSHILGKNNVLKNFSVVNKNAIKESILSDKRYQQGRSLSLIDGIPISIKDIINTKHMKTTAASNILKDNISSHNATVVNKLRRNGAIIIGKTNLDEFAMGSATNTGIWGECNNYINISKTAGGSSGGAANSISSNMSLGSLGTDTGGSVRLPASFCGVVGMRPTYGRVSRFGLIAFASSLDQIGIVTKDVPSAALLLQYISGYDSKDATSSSKKTDNYILNIYKSLKEKKIGIPIEFFNNIDNIVIQKTLIKLIEFLKYNKINIRYISLASSNSVIATYYILAISEASSNLSRFTGTLFGSKLKLTDNKINFLSLYRGIHWGMEIKRRILLGTYVLNSHYADQYYFQAQKVRKLIHQDYIRNFELVDLIISPTSPILPFDLSKKQTNLINTYLIDIYNVGASIVGLPAISVNIGDKNTPIGIHIIGRFFDESSIINLASILESNYTT